MAKSAKGPVKAKASEIAPDLIALARDALKDPQVVSQILEHGATVLGAARQWGASVADNIGDRFGQSGLEHRAARLSTAVAALSKDSPSLAASLRPVTESLDEVDKLLKVSAALPFAKRKKAHMRIDNVLDELEKGLFDATLRGVRPDPQT